MGILGTASHSGTVLRLLGGGWGEEVGSGRCQENVLIYLSNTLDNWMTEIWQNFMPTHLRLRLAAQLVKCLPSKLLRPCLINETLELETHLSV